MKDLLRIELAVGNIAGVSFLLVHAGSSLSHTTTHDRLDAVVEMASHITPLCHLSTKKSSLGNDNENLV